MSGFHKWLGNDKKAAMAYSRAVELKADILADETIEIADNDEDSARARNRINARQWLAGKLNRKYGERVDLNVIQTIDIGSTLAEARARMLPGSYQSSTTDAQVIDSIDVSGQRALDNQSKFLPANDVPTGDEYPNIFD